MLLPRLTYIFWNLCLLVMYTFSIIYYFQFIVYQFYSTFPCMFHGAVFRLCFIPNCWNYCYYWGKVMHPLSDPSFWSLSDSIVPALLCWNYLFYSYTLYYVLNWHYRLMSCSKMKLIFLFLLGVKTQSIWSKIQVIGEYYLGVLNISGYCMYKEA